MTTSAVRSLLQKEGFDEEDVVELFHKNKVDQETLMSLDREDMIELGLKALGDRKKLQCLQVQLSETSQTACHSTQLQLSPLGDVDNHTDVYDAAPESPPCQQQLTVPASLPVSRWLPIHRNRGMCECVCVCVCVCVCHGCHSLRINRILYH